MYPSEYELTTIDLVRIGGESMPFVGWSFAIIEDVRLVSFIWLRNASKSSRSSSGKEDLSSGFVSCRSVWLRNHRT
jgi:hypothetical protein